jgi:hypothetical protein
MNELRIAVQRIISNKRHPNNAKGSAFGTNFDYSSKCKRDDFPTTQFIFSPGAFRKIAPSFTIFYGMGETILVLRRLTQFSQSRTIARASVPQGQEVDFLLVCMHFRPPKIKQKRGFGLVLFVTITISLRNAWHRFPLLTYRTVSFHFISFPTRIYTLNEHE